MEKTIALTPLPSDPTPFVPDPVLDTGRVATADEIKQLRHVTGKIPGRVWLVALMAAAERFSYWGTQVTWQNYVQFGPDDPIPGVLGLGQASAVSINNAFNVVVFMLPVLFGPIADGWLGRYRTLQLCTAFYLIGMAVLFATSIPAAVQAGAGTTGFMVAICLIAIGIGGVQTVTQPLIADQYDEMVAKIAHTKKGERVVIDREMTINYIYSIYFWMLNIAALGQIGTSFMEKYTGYWSAYALTLGVLSSSVFILWFCKSLFILCSPSGTILPHAFRVLWIGVRSGFRLDAALPERQLELHGKAVAWEEGFVYDLRQALMAVKVCLAWPILYICIGFTSNNSIAQASQMRDVGGLPNNSLMATNSIAFVVCGIAAEKGLYPFLAKHKIKFGTIKRIASGLFIMAVAVAYGTIVQAQIYAAGPCYQYPLECVASENGTIPNDVNLLVQIPLYVLVAPAEIFAFVTGTAYVYNKAPKNMKSVMQSFYAVMCGLGYVFVVAIGPASRNPYLVIVWACVAGAMALTGVIFSICFRHYDRRDAARLQR